MIISFIGARCERIGLFEWLAAELWPEIGKLFINVCCGGDDDWTLGIVVKFNPKIGGNEFNWSAKSAKIFELFIKLQQPIFPFLILPQRHKFTLLLNPIKRKKGK